MMELFHNSSHIPVALIREPNSAMIFCLIDFEWSLDFQLSLDFTFIGVLSEQNRGVQGPARWPIVARDEF